MSSTPHNSEGGAAPPQPGPTVHIGEEFGTAKKSLPSLKIVAIVLGIIVLIAGIYAFVQRPRASATGAIEEVIAVEIPGQNAVMVAINVSFDNHGKKPFWIHTMKAEVDTGSGTFSDDAASAVDFERYFQAFPALGAHALEPLRNETKIESGGSAKGTLVVSFPLTAEAFANRKSLKVIIEPYDQPVALVLTK
jgi:hypothetical protein